MDFAAMRPMPCGCFRMWQGTDFQHAVEAAMSEVSIGTFMMGVYEGDWSEGYTTPYMRVLAGVLLVTMSTTTNRDTLQ